MRKARNGLGAVFATLLAACASTGGLKPEAALTNPATLSAEQSLAGARLSPAAWPAADWWKAYRDPQLDALMAEAFAGNPSLKVADARVRKALALAGVAKSALYPQITGSASSSRERFSEHGIIPPPYAGTWSYFSNLAVDFSYDLDFWGRNRTAYASALDHVHAAQVDAYAARLFLSTGIARAYVQLQRAYEQRDIAGATLKQREQMLELTRQRVGAGLDSRIDEKQAEAAIPEIRERIVVLNEAIQLTRNQLAALLGQGPDRGLAIARPQARALGEPVLPSAVPASLIGRRPDIVAQRWRVESAAKDIDVAKAQFYPDVNLALFAGLQSLGPLSQFFRAGNVTAGITPALTLPIFNGGRLRSNLAARDADYDVAVEQYNQALVDALHEVVDQLTSFRALNDQRVQIGRGLRTAEEAHALAVTRYRAGVGNYLQVLSSEAQVLQQRSLGADLRARELDLSINLTRALGGGYDAPVDVAAAGAR